MIALQPPPPPTSHRHTFYNHETRNKSECGHTGHTGDNGDSGELSNGDRKPGRSFQPRRIMCSHCVLVEDFWLNTSEPTYNARVNKKYRYNYSQYK